MIPVVVRLCAKPAEVPFAAEQPRRGGYLERLPCNRESGHPGTCSAKGRPTDAGDVELRLKGGPRP